MVNTTSSDPTSKGASMCPSHHASSAPAHAPAESLAAGVETPNDGSPPRGPFGSIYRKVRRGNKLIDWQFIGKKSIWFLGESNLNRVPAFHNSDIQIDSFPGLNFYHLWQILDRTPVHPHVKVLVLLAGVNNKDLDPHKTSTKQLRLIYNRAQCVFPNASIYIPVLNFSTSLSQEQQTNLSDINNFIHSRFPFLEPLPNAHFHNVSDGVHWTPATVSKMLMNWCAQLQINL